MRLSSQGDTTLLQSAHSIVLLPLSSGQWPHSHSFSSLPKRPFSPRTTTMLLGRKIIDHYPDDPPHGTPKLKSPNLTIEIDNYSLSAIGSRFSRDRACTRESLAPVVSPLYTPDSSHTFGIPNLTSTSGRDRRSRQTRSSLAEQALAVTLQSCSPESSPQEMQIRVLEQATTLIYAYAIDAQENEAEQTSFNDFGHPADEPDARLSPLMESMTPELAIDFESQLLHQHIQHLSQAFGLPRDDEFGQDSEASKEDRQLANLAKFLQTSLTLASTGIHRNRRRTMEDVGTLRKWSYGGPSTMEIRTRSRSLGHRCSIARTRNARRRAWRLPSKRIYDKMTEPAIAELSQPGPSPSPKLPQPRKDGNLRETSHPHRSSLGHDSPERGERNITIYQSALAQSRIDLLSEFESQEVQLPQYAQDLIDDLDYMVDSIPLKVLIAPIGQQLLPSFPSTLDAVSQRDEDEEEPFGMDDSMSEFSFRALSTITSNMPPSPVAPESRAPSIFRFILRSTELIPKPKPKPSMPTLSRKYSFLNLLQRNRQDSTTENRSRVRSTFRKFIPGWFRR